MQVPKDLVAEEAHQKPAFADAQVDPQAGMVGGKSQAQQQAEAELEARNTEQQQQPQQQQAQPQQRVPDELLKPAVVSDEDQKAAAVNKASALAAISASQNAGRQQRTAVKEGGALEHARSAAVCGCWSLPGVGALATTQPPETTGGGCHPAASAGWQRRVYE